MFGREPAVIIGTIVTIAIAVISTLSGNGFISDVAAGKATDLVNSLAGIAIIVAPLIAGIAIRSKVTPVA